MGEKPVLKKCPCCNSTADIKIPLRGYFKTYYVGCNSCGLVSRTAITPDEATELWNNRKPLETLVNQIRERAIEANKNMELSDDIAEASAYGGQWLAFTEAAVLIEEG